MTDVTKNQIRELREKGYGYKKIASELGITASAVRHQLVQIENEQLCGKCKMCGVPIKSIKGKKSKQFCSDKCRMQWWRLHDNLINRKAFYKFECLNCKKVFEVYGNSHRKYCCTKCYLSARRGDEND